MGAKELADRPVKELSVEIASEAAWEPPCIHKVSPKGVGDGIAGQVGQSVCPGTSGRYIDQEEAIFVPPWTGAVAKPNVDANGVASFGWALGRSTTAASFHRDGVANGEWGFVMVRDVKARAQVWEDLIVKLAATKMAVNVGAGQSLDRGDVGLGNVISRDDRCVWRGCWLGCGGRIREKMGHGLGNATVVAAGRREGRQASSRLQLASDGDMLSVFNGSVGVAGSDGEEEVFGVIDVQNKGRKCEPAAEVVGD
jgi:hypothetical protein